MKQWHYTALSVGLSPVGHLPTLTNLSKQCGVLAKVILVQCVVVTRVAQAGLLNTQHITSDTQMSCIAAHQVLWQDVMVFFELASSHLSSTSHVSQWMSVYMYVCIYVYIYHIRLILVLPAPPKNLELAIFGFRCLASSVEASGTGCNIATARPIECEAEGIPGSPEEKWCNDVSSWWYFFWKKLSSFWYIQNYMNHIVVG